MGTRGLIKRQLAPQGFRYVAGDSAASFVDCLVSPYAKALKERVDWLGEEIIHLSEQSFEALIGERLDLWNPEFLDESTI